MTQKISILLVDDNQNFIELLKDRIEFSDTFCVTGEAYDGEKALELMLSLRPDIVILDMIMPLLDGLGVLERFSRSGVTDYKPKIIVLSAIGQDSLTSQAMTLGAKYYMVKPIDFDLLIERLEQIIHEENSSANGLQHSEDQVVHRRITEVLQHLGVPPHIKGFVYLRDAIGLVYEDETQLMRITKTLYPSIAAMHDSTPQRVERSIRNAVELTFQRGSKTTFTNFFKLPLPSSDGRITNGEFIAYIANYVRSEMQRETGIS
jgi:two-component system response regulator (stage 0 sporulation protein A)